MVRSNACTLMGFVKGSVGNSVMFSPDQTFLRLKNKTEFPKFILENKFKFFSLNASKKDK